MAKNDGFTALYALLAVIIVMLGFNQFQLSTTDMRVVSNVPVTGAVVAQQASGQGASVNQPQQQSQAELQAVIDKIMPKGIPEVYGAELKVSFDDVEKGLDILGNLDADLNPGKGGIKFDELTQTQKDRYLKIGFMIACEYCCGATSLIQKNGQPACGCSHSAAMRGLAKYLLKNHENEFTDEQILDHLTKWKTLFFPKQMVAKYMQSQGISGAQLPNMVGGC